MSNIEYRRGAVYSLQFHIVWCTKYRRCVLNPGIMSVLNNILAKIAKDNGCRIEELNYGPDHLHILLASDPEIRIPSLIKALKGSSARLLFREFPDLKSSLWGGHLWNPTYFIATVSENTEQQIREYIRGRDNGAGV